jgi:hypothetical protein
MGKCDLYQERYDRQSGLSLSGHFLKYATIAINLDIKSSEVGKNRNYKVSFSIQCAKNDDEY